MEKSDPVRHPVSLSGSPVRLSDNPVRLLGKQPCQADYLSNLESGSFFGESEDDMS